MPATTWPMNGHAAPIRHLEGMILVALGNQPSSRTARTLPPFGASAAPLADTSGGAQNRPIWCGLPRGLGDDRTCMICRDEEVTHRHIGRIALARTVTLAVIGESLFAMYLAVGRLTKLGNRG